MTRSAKSAAVRANRRLRHTAGSIPVLYPPGVETTAKVRKEQLTLTLPPLQRVR